MWCVEQLLEDVGVLGGGCARYEVGSGAGGGCRLGEGQEGLRRLVLEVLNCRWKVYLKSVQSFSLFHTCCSGVGVGVDVRL